MRFRATFEKILKGSVEIKLKTRTVNIFCPMLEIVLEK